VSRPVRDNYAVEAWHSLVTASRAAVAAEERRDDFRAPQTDGRDAVADH
jgi:hypothetical protein